MKIGKEVEGRLKGIPTLFCDASVSFQDIREAARDNVVSHIYISDNDNTLNYQEIWDELSDFYVTLDVTEVFENPRPSNVSLMLRIDERYVSPVKSDTWKNVSLLTDNDQIKFERRQYVIVLPMSAAIRTHPLDFQGDIEL